MPAAAWGGSPLLPHRLLLLLLFLLLPRWLLRPLLRVLMSVLRRLLCQLHLQPCREGGCGSGSRLSGHDSSERLIDSLCKILGIGFYTDLYTSFFTS